MEWFHRVARNEDLYNGLPALSNHTLSHVVHALAGPLYEVCTGLSNQNFQAASPQAQTDRMHAANATMQAQVSLYRELCDEAIRLEFSCPKFSSTEHFMLCGVPTDPVCLLKGMLCLHKDL